MKPSKGVATVIGVVCGAELIIAAVIGGAGLSAFFGWNGLFVAVTAIVGIAVLIVRRRRPTSGAAPADPQPDIPISSRQG